jgi:hypothetical protein
MTIAVATAKQIRVAISGSVARATQGCARSMDHTAAKMPIAGQGSSRVRRSLISLSLRLRGVACRRVAGREPAHRRSLLSRALSFAAVSMTLLCPTASVAKPLEFDGTLMLDFFDRTFTPSTFAGTDVAIAVPGGNAAALETLRLRTGLTGGVTVLVTDPEAIGNQVFAARLTAGIGGATLAPFQPPNPLGPQLTQKTLPIPGVVRLCLLNSSCSVAASIPLTEEDGARGLGVGGLIAVSELNGLVSLTIEGAPWSVGTATLPVTTSSGQTVTAFAFGFVHGPNSFTGTTATAGGVINLVTPIATAVTEGPNLSGFGHLEIRFVPEPGPLVGLTACLVGLFALARNRSHR